MANDIQQYLCQKMSAVVKAEVKCEIFGKIGRINPFHKQMQFDTGTCLEEDFTIVILPYLNSPAHDGTFF